MSEDTGFGIEWRENRLPNPPSGPDFGIEWRERGHEIRHIDGQPVITSDKELSESDMEALRRAWRKRYLPPYSKIKPLIAQAHAENRLNALAFWGMVAATVAAVMWWLAA